MTRPSNDLDTLLADSSRFAAALSRLFVHAVGLVSTVAERTDDPKWRAVVVEMDLLVARLRQLAAAAEAATGETTREAATGEVAGEVAGKTAAEAAECRVRPAVHTSLRLLRQARMRRPPQA